MRGKCQELFDLVDALSFEIGWIGFEILKWVLILSGRLLLLRDGYASVTFAQILPIRFEYYNKIYYYYVFLSKFICYQIKQKLLIIIYFFNL